MEILREEMSAEPEGLQSDYDGPDVSPGFLLWRRPRTLGNRRSASTPTIRSDARAVRIARFAYLVAIRWSSYPARSRYTREY